MGHRHRAPRHDQAAIRPLLGERRDGALDLAGISQVDWTQLDAE